jgi:hypothetical protein
MRLLAAGSLPVLVLVVAHSRSLCRIRVPACAVSTVRSVLIRCGTTRGARDDSLGPCARPDPEADVRPSPSFPRRLWRPRRRCPLLQPSPVLGSHQADQATDAACFTCTPRRRNTAVGPGHGSDERRATTYAKLARHRSMSLCVTSDESFVVAPAHLFCRLYLRL